MGVTNIDGVSGTRSASYTYDSLGNVTSFTDPNYATTTREYDILGRINRIVLDNGEEIVYNYNDTTNSVSYTDLNGAVKTLYFSDNGNLCLETASHGDVIALVSKTGSTVAKYYEYDAFGNEINPDASDTNHYRYCGEYYDFESGTIYLRARYMNAQPFPSSFPWYYGFC